MSAFNESRAGLIFFFVRLEMGACGSYNEKEFRVFCIVQKDSRARAGGTDDTCGMEETG